MIRLDRYLCEMGEGTRSEVKELLRKGRVSVDGCPEKNPARKVDEKSVQVCVDGRLISYAKNVYFLMNKPSGLLSATRDGHGRTVLDWMREREPENVLLRRDLFPVGRLDKDTEGLLLITDDGALAHRLLSPARHVKKTYYVETRSAQTVRMEHFPKRPATGFVRVWISGKRSAPDLPKSGRRSWKDARRNPVRPVFSPSRKGSTIR